MASLILKSALASDIARFIEFKEAVCGTVNKTRRWYMRSFDSYCAENGFATCCKEAVEGWGSEIEARQPGTPRSWTGPIRQFAKFLQNCGCEEAYVLPDSFGYVRRRVRPYVLRQQHRQARRREHAGLHVRPDMEASGPPRSRIGQETPPVRSSPSLRLRQHRALGCRGEGC